MPSFVQRVIVGIPSAVAALALLISLVAASQLAAQPGPPEQTLFVEVRRLGFEWQSDHDLRSAACSPDGRLIAFGGSQQVGVWNATTGSSNGAFAAAGTNHFYSVAWGANDTLYAAGQGRDIYRWNATTNELVQTYSKHTSSVQRISISADGSRLASSCRDNKVFVWKMPQGEIVRELTVGGPNPAAAHMGAIALSPDGKTLVAPSSRKNAFEVFDVETGAPRTITYDTTAFARQCLFTPDGKRLLIRDGEKLTVYDVAAGRVIPHLTRELPVYFGDMAVSPDSRTLAMVGHVRVELSSLETGKTLHVIPGPGGTLDGVAFRRDGKSIFAGGYKKTIYRWDVATGRSIESATGHRGGVEAVVWPVPERIITASDDRSIRFWDHETGEQEKAVEMPAGLVPRSFTSDGRKLLARSDKNLHVVDTDTGATVKLEASSEWDRQPAISPDGKWVAYAQTTDRHELRLIAADGKSPPRILAGSDRSIHACAFSADGARLAVGYQQKYQDRPEPRAGPGERILRGDMRRWSDRDYETQPTVMLFDVASGRPLEAFGEELHGVMRLEFSPSGRHLAIGSAENEVFVRDLDRHLLLPGTERVSSEVTQFVFSPDERCLMAIARETAQGFSVFELETLTPLAQFRGADGQLISVAVSPDGRRIACGGRDSRTIVWGFTASARAASSSTQQPQPSDLNAEWLKLGALRSDQAENAYRSFIAGGDAAVSFLRDKLKPVPALDLQDVALRLAQLDSNKFAVRDAAARELHRTAYLIEAELRKHLAATKSPEVRRRLSVLLESLHADPERLRALRSVYALGAIGTPPAVATLEKLAGGEPRDRFTQNAKAALRRSAQ
jgi:WD40 repeat protein